MHMDVKNIITEVENEWILLYACCWYDDLGNIEAVDTFRPKGDRVTKLKDTDASNAGAIGEIADAKNPILPLSPKLYPTTH